MARLSDNQSSNPGSVRAQPPDISLSWQSPAVQGSAPEWPRDTGRAPTRAPGHAWRDTRAHPAGGGPHPASPDRGATERRRGRGRRNSALPVTSGQRDATPSARHRTVPGLEGHGPGRGRGWPPEAGGQRLPRRPER